MSKKISRNFIVAFLAVITFFAAFLFLKPLKASAEGEPSNENGTFEMVEGASVTLGKDGLRYIVKMDKTVYDTVVTNDAANQTKLSFYIAPARVFQSADGDYSNLSGKTEIEVNESQIYKIGDYYYANAVYANVGTNNQQKLDFAAVALITSQGGVRYASFVDGELDNNVRNMYEVLNAAALDSEEEYTAAILGENSPYAWFATEDYPLSIETIGDYENLVTLVNAGKSFEGKYLYRNNTLDLSESSVDLASGKTLPTIHADFDVEFRNADGSVITTIKVPSGGSIDADTLAEIVPRDIENKLFDGWAEISNVQDNMTITATYKDVFTITFKDANSAVIGTLKVAQGEKITQDQLDEMKDFALGVVDARCIGWSNSDVGTSDISEDILSAEVSGSVTYYAVYEHKIALKINVNVANYSWALNGDGADTVPEQYREFIVSGVIGYLREATAVYEEKSEQFADLIGTPKGYVGEDVDLSAFFAGLNDCYSVNKDQSTDLSGLKIASDTEINIYLDWNEEKLGFSAADVINTGSWIKLKAMGLMRDPETGIAGLGLVYDATVQQRGESRIRLKPNLSKTSYQGIIVKFSYKSTADVNVTTLAGDHRDQDGKNVLYPKNQKIDDGYLTYVYDAVNDNASDELTSVAFCPQGERRECTLIVESITYVESGSKTYSAADLMSLSAPSYSKARNSWDGFINKNDRMALSIVKDADDNDVEVLRYTTTAFVEYDWIPLGVLFRFGNVNYDNYSSIIIKFKADTVVNLFDGDDTNWSYDYVVSEEVYEIDLLQTKFYTMTNDIGYNLNGSTANGFMLGAKPEAGTSFTLDIYSIEFVEKAAE